MEGCCKIHLSADFPAGVCGSVEVHIDFPGKEGVHERGGERIRCIGGGPCPGKRGKRRTSARGDGLYDRTGDAGEAGVKMRADAQRSAESLVADDPVKLGKIFAQVERAGTGGVRDDAPFLRAVQTCREMYLGRRPAWQESHEYNPRTKQKLSLHISSEPGTGDGTGIIGRGAEMSADRTECPSHCKGIGRSLSSCESPLRGVRYAPGREIAAQIRGMGCVSRI